MWTQLAMAGLNAYQNEKNRMNDIASNVIDSKYGAWTGARPDWSSQGKQSGMKTMTQGVMSGMLQDKEDAKAAQENERYNEWMKMQKDAKAATPSRAPAVVTPQVQQSAIPAQPTQAPMMAAQGTGPQPIAPNAPFSFTVQGAPAQIPYAPTTEQDLLKASNPWMSMVQNYQPQQDPTRMIASQPSNDPTAANRDAMGQFAQWITPKSSPLYNSVWGK